VTGKRTLSDINFGKRSTTKRKPKRAKDLGATDADYVRILEAQDGHCALCPSEPKTRRLHFDHDHRTGKVRGLLCHRCNRALGTWCNSEWALRLFGYLKNAEQA
jgi:hypothetical protein